MVLFINGALSKESVFLRCNETIVKMYGIIYSYPHRGDANYYISDKRWRPYMNNSDVSNKKSYNIHSSTSKQQKAVLCAILAAVLYAISAPASKILLVDVSPTFMAAFLYLGAGAGMTFLGCIFKKTGRESREIPLTRNDLKYTVAMVMLDIAAPIMLMIGLSMTTAANASLLNNFEIVATSIIALLIFKETITKRSWIAIILVTISSLLLSFKNIESLSFSYGSLFVLFACVCWGFENNCTRMISDKNPLHIVVIKGFGSGLGSLIIALIKREAIPGVIFIFATLVLGFVAYGLSVFFYVHAQRELGAARTSTYYAMAPFVGAVFSLLIFREIPSVIFVVAFLIMIVGTFFASLDKGSSNF